MGPIKLKFTGSASSTYQGYIVNKQLASYFETIRSIVKKLEEKGSVLRNCLVSAGKY